MMENPSPNLQKSLVWGSRGALGGVLEGLGAPGRALGAILAPKTNKSEKKVLRCPPLGPPSCGQNSPQIEITAFPKASWSKKDSILSVLVRVLVLVLLLGRRKVDKLMIFGRPDLIKHHTALHFGRCLYFL